MSISLEAMLQLSIILPLFAVAGIVATGSKPNLREGVTLSTSLVLLYFVVELYQGIKQGEIISVQWWEILPGSQLSFTIEPLGMIFCFNCQFPLAHYNTLRHRLYA